MKIVDIASKFLDKIDGVPIYYYNDSTKEFSCNLYLREGSNNPIGLFLPKCDTLEVFEHYKKNKHVSFLKFREMISTKCDFNDISFSVFAILHELGHWIHYNNYRAVGHSKTEYRFFYELPRYELLKEFDDRSNNCSDEEYNKLQAEYEELYFSLEDEKIANKFALDTLLGFMVEFKEM